MNNPPDTASQTVCIIIAAYNAQATIERAIKSALAEPEVNEVIVVDDASTDNTIAVATGADDGTGRLKVLRQPANAGPSAARNRAIAESKSGWIGILDADDFFVKGRISALLKASSEADLIADDMWQVSEHAPNGERKSLLFPAITAPKTITFSEFVLSNVTRSNRERGELGFIKPLIRKSFLDNNHIRYQESMRLGEDFELYARALALKARLIIIPTQGYVSVVRSNSLSSQHSENDLLHLRDCDHALEKSLSLSQQDKNALREHYLSIDCRLQWRLLINAVKSRNIAAALQTFLRPYPVPLYLMKQLAHQCILRSLSKTKHYVHAPKIST